MGPTVAAGRQPRERAQVAGGAEHGEVEAAEETQSRTAEELQWRTEPRAPALPNTELGKRAPGGGGGESKASYATLAKSSMVAGHRPSPSSPQYAVLSARPNADPEYSEPGPAYHLSARSDHPRPPWSVQTAPPRTRPAREAATSTPCRRWCYYRRLACIHLDHRTRPITLKTTDRRSLSPYAR